MGCSTLQLNNTDPVSPQPTTDLSAPSSTELECFTDLFVLCLFPCENIGNMLLLREELFFALFRSRLKPANRKCGILLLFNYST